MFTVQRLPSFRIKLLLCCAFLICRTPPARADPSPTNYPRLSEAQVSFTVHNPLVPGEAIVRGTLIQPANPKKATGTAVIFLHGAISDRNSWLAPLDGLLSMPHTVADRGHAVFVLDRLGYGQSVYDPFPGAGWAITTQTQVHTLHEIVTQIRAADYVIDGGSAEQPQAPDRVVLLGISLGGGIAQNYVTHFDDVDGVVSLAWSNQTGGDAINLIFANFVIPQLMLGLDYAYFFPPSDGFSEECAWMFHQPNVDPDILFQVCTDGFLGTSPSGELASVPDLAADTLANVQNATTPILLVYGEFDSFFPVGDYRGLFGNDPDTVTPDIQIWQNRSNAEVDVLIVPDTGHAIHFHDKTHHTTHQILNWIDDL